MFLSSGNAGGHSLTHPIPLVLQLQHSGADVSRNRFLSGQWHTQVMFTQVSSPLSEVAPFVEIFSVFFSNICVQSKASCLDPDRVRLPSAAALSFTALKNSSELIAWAISSLSSPCICWCSQALAFAASPNCGRFALGAYQSPGSTQGLCWPHPCPQICSHLCHRSLWWCQVFSVVYEDSTLLTLQRHRSGPGDFCLANSNCCAQH